ncbi:BTAD domain-containing putative transcriptional regulator [Actinoplanes sp. NPDC051851]|uniref:AfsR/SARP family transcriptional regulator n=1 Tax=Actinoplanes sp. NPDC051851 TaxID=3154753 RepID=UPI0034345657
MTIRFEVLGPLRVRRDGRDVELGKSQLRVLLGALLVAGGRPVTVTELIDVTWGDAPPETALNGIQRNVNFLRRLLEPGLAPRDPGHWLVHSGNGYRIAVTEENLDLLRFRELTRQGADAERFTQALRLWQGPVLADLDARIRELPVVVGLDREYQEAARRLADLALEAGAADRVLPVVRQAADRHPMDEALQARVMSLLAAAGRQGEALDVYRRATERLADELGVRPGSELRDVHRKLLSQDAEEPAPPRPAQLPPDLAVFAGREAELADVLAVRPTGTSPVVISAIGGMAGIGKTTLAVHWAHRVAARFPDGQLYLNLRGFDPSGRTMEPGDALVRMLGALGVPESRIPAGRGAKAALFRSSIWGRRMLVVLDNVRDEQHVRDLLPASPGCLVIVTSRNSLAGLIAAEGATAVTLDVLDGEEACAFLARRLGARRVDAEPEAVAAIVACCGGLPLALAVVAARAALRPRQSLLDIANELRSSRGLDAFVSPDPSVSARAVFSWSYTELSPAAARLFRTLAIHPGPDVTAPAAASLAGIGLDEAVTALAELTTGNLLGETTPGRFQFHDLLRAYAGELLDPGAAGEARQRMLDHYLHSAGHAKLAMLPDAVPVPLGPPAAGVIPERAAGPDEALAWLRAELWVLIEAVGVAGAHGYDQYVWKLTWSTSRMSVPVETEAHLLTMSLAAAERLGDDTVIARMLHGLSIATYRVNRLDEAMRYSLRSLELAERHDNGPAQIRLLVTLGQIHERGERFDLLTEYAARALAIALPSGEPALESLARASLGWGYANTGAYEQAFEQGRLMMELAEKLDSRRDRGTAFQIIGLCHLRLGEHHTAIACFRESLDLVHDIDEELGEWAVVWTLLGDAYLASGDPDAARWSWREAVTIAEELDPWMTDRIRAKLNSLP